MGIHVVHNFKTFLIDQLNNNLLFNLKRFQFEGFVDVLLNHLFIRRESHGYVESNILPPGDALSPVICGQLLLACVKHTSSAFSRNMCQKS